MIHTIIQKDPFCKRSLGAQSSAAAAKRLLGPLAVAKIVDGSARPQGLTSLDMGFFVADLPLWIPRSWRHGLCARAERRWGSLRFVQKRFSVSQEADVLRCLYLAFTRTSRLSSRPVPLVLGLSQGDESGQVLMEDLPGIGALELTAPAEAAVLAEHIFRLETCLAEAEDCSGIALERHRILANLRRLRILMRRTEDPSYDRLGLIRRVNALAKALEGYPTLLNHNDIGPGNMAVRKISESESESESESGSELEIRFIDFGSVNHNVIGADLHHYAAWGLDSSERYLFFEHLSSRYAQLISQSVARLRAGAYAYALERSMMRWWRRKERQQFPARARAFLLRIEILLERAEAEMVMASQES